MKILEALWTMLPAAGEKEILSLKLKPLPSKRSLIASVFPYSLNVSSFMSIGFWFCGIIPESCYRDKNSTKNIICFQGNEFLFLCFRVLAANASL